MRVRNARPRQFREMEICNALFAWQNAFRTVRMPVAPFLGAVLPESPASLCFRPLWPGPKVAPCD